MALERWDPWREIENIYEEHLIRAPKTPAQYRRKSMKATVNPDLCTGCGICEIVCPEVFRMNRGGWKDFAVVHSETVPEEAEIFCVDARDCCTPKAIQVVATGCNGDRYHAIPVVDNVTSGIS